MTGAPEVLWVEDDAGDRMLLQESLPPGWPVRIAASTEQMLAQLQHQAPDLLVLDIKIPRVSGVEILERLRQSLAWRHLPVVVFSSSSQPDERARCEALGVRAFIQKPLDFAGFQQAVRQVLSHAGPRLQPA